MSGVDGNANTWLGKSEHAMHRMTCLLMKPSL